MTRRKRAAERGQSLIEGLLVLIVLMAILIALFDFGQVMFLHQTLTERVRAAARYAALHPDRTEAVRNVVVFGGAAAPAGVASGFWGLTPSMVSVVRIHPDTHEDSMVVTVSGYRFRLFSLWIAGATRGKPITATAPVEVL